MGRGEGLVPKDRNKSKKPLTRPAGWLRPPISAATFTTSEFTRHPSARCIVHRTILGCKGVGRDNVDLALDLADLCYDTAIQF